MLIGVDDSEDDSQAYQYLDRFHMADYEAGLTNVSARYENTCQWLLENDEFQIWAAETPSRIFWLSGYPGQGKSVLAKFVTQSSTKGEPGSELTLSLASKLRSEKPVVCYFFCSSDDDRTQSIRHLVGCLIHQMIIQYPNCAAPIEKTWRVIDVDVTESVESMWAVFFKALSAIKNRTLLLVIDAVDELEKKWWSLLLKQVNKAIKTAKTKVLVFITSRREPEIVRQLTPWQVRQFSLDNSRNTKDDILSFINGVVEQYAEENSFDETVAQKICSILKGRADGMFLWVTLAWSHFIDGVGFWNNETQKNRLAELERLPPGIDALYYRILTNVDPRLHLQLLDALRWIALAKRPLTLLDLSIALALKERPADSEELDRVISIEQFLRERCAHVIKIREGYITVTHQSFRDFLFEAKDVRTSNGTVTNQFYLDKSKDDCRVGLDCMTYLSLSDIPAPTDQMRQYHTVTNDPGTLRKFQFLEYSALYWFVHVAPQDDEFVEQIYSAFLKLIRSPPNFKAMCAGNKGGAYEIYNRPLFLAFRLGLDRIVEKLVKDGFNINEEDHDGNHIIHQTRRKDEIIMHPVGKLDTFTRVLESSDVNFLLGLGADINGRNDLEQTVLIRLVRSLHGDEAGIAEFKEWLQRLGVDINARDHVGATALHAAVVLSPKASDPVIAALIQRDDLDPNVQDNDGLTPLTRAIHWGKEHAARQLLKHPLVEVDKGLPFGESPLLNAASQYWEDVVRLILERLTTVDEYRDTTAKTILHWSVITGMRKCLALALDKQKATIDAPDSRGMTALHYAAQDGDLNAVLALLNRGAKVTAKNRFCETALHLAAQGGHTRVVQTLLQHVPGFLLDERDGMGCTVLHRAVVSGNDALVRFLVGRADVDLRKRDRHGRTPLAYAAAYGSLDTFKALMAGAPIFEGDGFGYSLLHFAMLGHNEPTIEFLLQPCGEAEAKYRSSLESLQRHCGKNSENRWGKTPLDYVPETSALVPGMRERGLRNSETHLRQEARLMFERRDTVETVYGEDLVMVVQTVDERAAAQEMLTT
jgi:ankyrin repeat protein